ncbi:MAG: DUF1569 domain-containing protein [Crocinitomicaceae bacterium]|nr:DUF1569 domain-containing protein [Crocinitomicaceae bacterium]
MSDFLSPDLETFLGKINNLSADTCAEWGVMSAQQMIEHLSNTIDLSTGKIKGVLSIPEDKVERALTYLHSEKPFPKGVKVAYAPEKPKLRNEDLETAIDELTMKWIAFEEYYHDNPEAENMHPVYGVLGYEGWLRIHSKHFTHHFLQFNL